MFGIQGGRDTIFVFVELSLFRLRKSYSFHFMAVFFSPNFILDQCRGIKVILDPDCYPETYQMGRTLSQESDVILNSPSIDLEYVTE